jgi:hypothetical protein
MAATPKSNWDHGPGAIVKVGHGGWSIHYRSLPDSHVSNSTLSGYGDDWRTRIDELEPGALVVDLTAIPWSTLYDLSIRGPMMGADVPVGEIRSLGGTRPVDRSQRFYGAGSFDFLSAADYADLAREHGAEVYPAAEARAAA